MARRGAVSLEVEREIEANFFAIGLIMEEGLFRDAVTHLLTALDRPQELRGFVDLLDDPAVSKLARLFVVSEQMVVIRLCMLGYFEPYVKGR